MPASLTSTGASNRSRSIASRRRCSTRAPELDQERQRLEARREPERRRSPRAGRPCRTPKPSATSPPAAFRPRAISTRGPSSGWTMEQDVERARGDVYAVVNTLTALHAAAQSAGAQRERAVESEQRFALESRELTAELEPGASRAAVVRAQLRRAQEELEAARLARGARETELASARIEHEWRARDVRTREQELARTSSPAAIARGDGRPPRRFRRCCAHGAGERERQGWADGRARRLPGSRAALRTCGRGVPGRPAPARAGRAARARLCRPAADSPGGCRSLRLRRGRRTARTFERQEEPTRGVQTSEVPVGAVRLQDVVRIGGPFSGALRAAIGEAWISESFDAASRVAPFVPFPVATLEGDVFRGRHIVTGGDKAEARGILATKRRSRSCANACDRARRAGDPGRGDRPVRADDRPRDGGD